MFVKKKHYSSLDFIVLGTARAGTTFLYYLLSQHPQVRLPAGVKETWFFDGPDYERGIAYYFEKYFQGPQGRTGSRDVWGEVASSYLYVPYVPERIYAVFPETKLIVILRDPIDRAFSDWWMMYNARVEPLRFEDAIQENLRRIQTGPKFYKPEEWYEHLYFIKEHKRLNYRTYVDYGYYEEQLERYLQLFPKENILLLQFEHFTRDPKKIVRRVFEFLGLTPDIPVKTEVPHNVTIASAKIRRVIENLRRFGVLDAVPFRLRHFARIALEKRFKKQKMPRIPDGVFHELREHFREHVKRLINLCSKDSLDVSLWSTIGGRNDR